MRKLLILVEPFFHGTQYLDIAERDNLETLILRRSDGPMLDRYKNTILVDLDNIDEAAKLVINYIEENGYEKYGIIPGNDFVVPFTFGLSEKLNLDYNTYDAGYSARNKYSMSIKFEENGVSIPQTFRVVSLEDLSIIYEKLSFPLIVKPVDMSSSMFVTQVNSELELTEQVQRLLGVNNNILGYKKDKSVLIQEFIPGNEFSVEMFLENGNVVYSSVTEKQKTLPPIFVELGHVVPPTNINETQMCSLIKEAEKAAKAIGLKNGPAHVEIVLNKNTPYVIEIAARIGGDNIMKLLREAYGVYLPELAVSQVLFDQVSYEKRYCRGASIHFLTANPGTITSVIGEERLNRDTRLIEYEIELKVGDKVESLESSEERIGYVIANGQNGVEAKENALELSSLIQVNVN